DDPPAVRAESREEHEVGVRQRGCQGSPSSCIPHPGGLVRASRHDAAAVGTELRMADYLVVLERRSERLSGRRVPDSRLAPTDRGSAARGNIRLIGAGKDSTPLRAELLPCITATSPVQGERLTLCGVPYPQFEDLAADHTLKGIPTVWAESQVSV